MEYGMKSTTSPFEVGRTIIFLAFTLCFCPALFSARDAAAVGTPTISVKITGDAPQGVTVEVSGDNLPEALTQKTPASGVVKFPGLKLGTYTVVSSKKGYLFDPEFKDATLTTAKTVKIKFSMDAAGSDIGMSECILCHRYVYGKNATKNLARYADWLQGEHGNFDFYDSEKAIINRYAQFLSSFIYPADYSKFVGYPDDAKIEETLKESAYAGLTAAYCLACHGPSDKDNKEVKGLPLVATAGAVDVKNKTQVSRPVVGCENCHGGGGIHLHAPKSRIPSFSTPSFNQCGQCHNADFPAPHLDDFPAGAGGPGNPGIVEAYKGSPHRKTIQDAEIYTNSKMTAVQAICAKCHTDEGAREFKDIDGDRSALIAAFSGKEPLKTFSPVQCRTCHNAHKPTELLEAATAGTGTVKARSTVFNTCTNCHQLLNDNDGKIVGYHDESSVSGLRKNHYDDPATKELEGYNFNRGSETACLNCHNPHQANLAINIQWAESGHGDFTGAFAAYDWKDNGTGTSTGRQACQRCHSTTGFINIVKDYVTYQNNVNNKIPNNDFSYLTGLQNEMLYCNGCHTDNAFNRRTVDTVVFPSGLSVSLGDDSNLCMMCHQGRASKKSIDDKINTGALAFTFTNIHYYAAGATLFGTEVKGGYEYDGNTYVGQNTFLNHAGDRNTCVKCHLRTGTADASDHHFLPQVGDCNPCHLGMTDFSGLKLYNMPNYLGDNSASGSPSAQIAGMQEALYTQIKAYALGTIGTPIIYIASTNPYWFEDTVKRASYTKFDAKLLKAAYNYQVSQKEPHGFIHNHRYIIQLLYDSIKDLGGSAAVAGMTRPL